MLIQAMMPTAHILPTFSKKGKAACARPQAAELAGRLMAAGAEPALLPYTSVAYCHNPV